jgi:hypothetical protein
MNRLMPTTAGSMPNLANESGKLETIGMIGHLKLLTPEARHFFFPLSALISG